MTEKELKEYYQQLTWHDWFYEYSDDHSVWRRGNQKKIIRKPQHSRFVKRMESIKKIWQKFVQLEKQAFLLNDPREWKHRSSPQAKILYKLRKRKSNKSSWGRFALPLVPILQKNV